MDHGNQVWVGTCEEYFTSGVKWEGFGLIVWGASDGDDGGESLIVFRDRSVDHASEGCIKNGFLFAYSEVLFRTSCWMVLLVLSRTSPMKDSWRHLKRMAKMHLR
jgi:hypothetical protein